MDQKKIQKFAERLKEAKSIVFFGGAGVSTESGIPDFRSKDGLYNQNDVQFDRFSPEYLLSSDCLYQHPTVFYEYYRQKLDTREIKPNITHLVLAKLEKIGKLSAVVTQNIDGLHQKAGSEKVYEIHGTTEKNYCHLCGKEYASDHIFQSKEKIPRCACGGMIRPDVTLYGEGLPEDKVRASIEAIQNADMLIIAGTSLRVMPAASFVQYFKGDCLVVINKEPVPIRLREQDLMLEGSLGDVFSFIEKEMEEMYDNI